MRTFQFGATQTNELIPTLPVFVSHIVPELQKPIDGSIHPIIKVDAMKYLLLFRNQVGFG
jgi:exportin-2 (importin alpha re-exporter)